MKTITCRGQLNKGYKKTSDAGFSLIELLIAVTILSIIVIPLLHMFVTSTRINVKSRQTLRATTVAQDIMEGLKAYTLEEVSAQFAPPEGVSGDAFHYPSDGFYILNSSLIQGGVRDLTEDMAEHEGVYYFGIENLKMQGAEYDALIRLDASTYGEDKDLYSNPHDNEFNNKTYAQIGSVAETNGGGGETTDSSYHENKKLAEAVMKYAKEDIGEQVTAELGALPNDWDDLWEDLEIADIVTKRVISVVIDDAGTKDAEGNEQCMATINFTYECGYIYNGITYTCTTSGYEGSEGGEVVNVPRTFSSGNFYLFYYPIYKLPLADSIKIEIKNTEKLLDKDYPLLKSITLAKQIRSEVDVSAGIIVPDLTDVELWEKESAYQVDIGISADATPKSKLILRSNVETNMAEMAKKKDPITGELKWDSIDGVGYSHDTHIMPYIDECDFIGDTTSDKVTNIIYDIEITVYQTGAAQHFTENNFENNDDVHRLATITNMNQ